MCNQRERLIGYVYNEGDAAELAEVQRHVESCGECRTEIAQLRAVREDLLAWDVPATESVWRPFTPAPVATPWWRQVPAWAMAAAAIVVLASGFAGGSFAHRFSGEPIARDENPPVVTAAFATPADVAAVQRLLTDLRAEMTTIDAKLRQTGIRDELGDLTRRVTALQGANEIFLKVLDELGGQVNALRDTAVIGHSNLDSKIKSLQQLVDQITSPAK